VQALVRLSLVGLLGLLAPTAISLRASTDRPMREVVEQALIRAAAQYDFMLHQLRGRDGAPRTWENGELVLTTRDWTAGFFPGALWLLYEAKGDEPFRVAAQRYTEALAPHQHNRRTHDVGFILHCSFGHGWRLTKQPAYREVLLNGAASLATRFDPKVGAIKSWDWSRQWEYPVIIDNLMNLELLLWAARESGEPRYREIAIRHADTTLWNHFRPNGSCYHVVDFDPRTGAVQDRVTHQGFADDSAWSRGQAWAIYGYTMLYRETREPRYLAQARAAADFVLKLPRLPADRIPWWDFDAPKFPTQPRDASAAAIMASALLELAGYVPKADAARYLAFAKGQLRSLASAEYLAVAGANGGFILKHSTGNRPEGREIDVPLNYADYYFLEALLRCRALLAREPSP
jgi:rhamnogalacturonyl hydrolase YesR